MKNYNKKIQEKVLLEDDGCILKCDCNGKIVIKNLCRSNNKALLKLSDIVSKLNNVEMSKKERYVYVRSIEDLGSLVNVDEDLAIRNIESLENNLEQGLKLKRRLQYVFTVVLVFLVLIMGCFFLRNILGDVSYTLICSSLGGILAILYKQDTVNIDYTVAIYAIILEALKRVVITIVVGVIGFVAIKADIVFPNLDNIVNKYTLDLVIIICGYSINFIPNILDKMLENNNSKNNK
ncbi:hypothetical protein HH195_04370 [Sarcina sp. JB2]|uniref:Uncharacterized protein n=1 Tax=Candidatus Sarcina troglodytae TaxID=2726954 RepID=A0ACD1BD35_9CLOT|nr:hypothetical protein [Sarcina sp. JB2]QPJ85187.1 hypothetical protein HH195_04370 [Sarcina sp. JB2]